MYYIVYCTTCIITKKWYVGVHSTNNLDDGYLGSGKILKRSIEKYGINNHVRRILFYCNSIEEAYSLEATMVNESILPYNRCMNLVVGGRGGMKKGNIPWNKGLKNPYSIEALNKMVNNKKHYPKQKPKYRYITPDGIFLKREDAALYYNITPQAITHRIKSTTYPEFKKEKL